MSSARRAALRCALLVMVVAGALVAVTTVDDATASAAGASNGSVVLNWDSGNSQTFDYTGGAQTFTVPAGVFEMQATAVGADGGSAPNFGSTGSVAGGTGTTETGTISVEPQETLYIYVGGAGQDAQQASCGGGDAEVYALGGFNGGADGGYVSGGGASGAGGGGASDVQTVASTSTDPEISSWLIGAGGGGGAGGPGEANGCTYLTPGGTGGAGGEDGGPGGALYPLDTHNPDVTATTDGGLGGGAGGNTPGAAASIRGSRR